MIGVKFPFTIGGGSVVTSSSEAEIIGSRVTFCLGTQVGERVMRPDWGLDIMNSVYAMGAGLESSVKDAVEEAFRSWFPDYELRGVTVEKDLNNPTYVTVHVRYGRFGSTLDEVSRVGTPIPGGAEIFDHEGYA